jgi:tetratricopeptide (TPR) repeat protein
VATNRDKLIAGAQKLVEKGQFEKAIKEFVKVVQQDDKDVRIWLKIGDLYAKIGKKHEAAEVYQKVAQFYSEQGFYLKSVAVYKQILKLDPRLVDVNQRLAELYKQLGLLSDAMMQYEAVAAFFHREGKTREALAALKQIVELDPETVANRIKLAELYSKESMPREAIDEFSKAAEQLREAGRTDDFMKVAERLLFHSPDNRPVSKELARMYIERGDPRRALPKLQVCFKADPRDADVLTLLARAFEALDQRHKAVSVLKELARILGENQDTRGRDEVFRKILLLEPGDPEAEAALGQRRRSLSSPALRTEGSGVRRIDARSISGAHPAPSPRGLHASTSAAQRAPADRSMTVPGHARAGWRSTDDTPPPPEEFDDPARTPVEDELGLTTLANDGPATGQTAVGTLIDSGESPLGDDEEIARLLNETDVYIKYKLYAKAIEHVQRVFDRDPQHVEAREKLKALFLTVGKPQDAVAALWMLVEQAEPGRQRRYVREILDIDPGNARALALLGPAEAHRGASLDDEEIEELSDEEFDIADPSEIRDARHQPQAGPPRYDAPPDAEDDLIPVVVEPLTPSEPATPSVDEVEDRFGFGEESHERRVASPLDEGDEGDAPFGPPEAFAPSDSEVRAVQSGIQSFDAHDPGTGTGTDMRTRFDPEPLKFLEHEPSEIDENELPSLDGLVPRGAPAQASEPARRTDAPENSLEDELDEGDFFVQQNLFEEARGILEGLLQRYPNHPLVRAKLRDLEAMEQAAGARPTGDAAGAEEVTPIADLSAELPDELPGSSEAAPDDSAPQPIFEMTRPRGVIEKGVTAEDFETHYDLGIAYKEMGLLDDAILEFKQVMRDPAREVQCYLMIGLCFIEKGLLSEAIGHFKKGLYVETITDRESLSLYFELGSAYERLGDPREALYYYEKVIKRDARFRNVEQHVEALRSGAAANPPLAASAGEDAEVTFEGLLGKDAS